MLRKSRELRLRNKDTNGTAEIVRQMTEVLMTEEKVDAPPRQDPHAKARHPEGSEEWISRCAATTPKSCALDRYRARCLFAPSFCGRREHIRT